ncbi:putative ABC transporter permease [Saliniradius amylolyticus]|uniref:Putative ABC transporter permease n=1 Tax=Saliniradius amylolyticus TaxID=2183582 RepID=A0A2S2E279_9ALTE|nr:FtsX-like permease family protein [Saliniradius amylolyticus]AWL11699.1 putative ABC transporter permease [Saliniradius amylolyticus]
MPANWTLAMSLAWRLFKHEARRGELSVILAAIVLSVGAVLSLSMFSERLQEALTERTAQFLAADRLLGSDKPAPREWIQQAHDRELRVAEKIQLRSMVFANGQLVLSDLRAVDDQYPLKGTIKIADKPFGQAKEVSRLPASGEVWLDSRLFQNLKLSKGDEVEIGDRSFTVTEVLSELPDGGFNVFGGDPLVLMRRQDMPATNLTGPGSRTDYDYLFAGEEQALEAYYQWLEPQLNRDIHYWRSIQDDDSPLGEAVNRAEQYFLLASLLAIVLASVSIAVAAQRFSQRHYDPVAIMKTLGASGRLVKRVYLLQVVFITLLGIFVGGIIGYGVQSWVAELIAERADIALGGWYWRPLAISLFTGLVCSLLFSLYPLLKLFSVPPLRVLRKDIEATLSSRTLQFAAAGGAIFSLMWAYSGNLKISAILFVSGIVLVLALLVVTYGLIALGRKLGGGSIGAWQLAWARIKRRAMDNSVQLMSFSITIMLLLVVLVMRNDMVQQWRDQLPQGTPNYFMINITEQKLPEVKQHFGEANVSTQTFYPVVRGRFAAVNDETVRTDVSKEEGDEGRQGLGRESNLTWSDNLQNANQVVAGQFHGNNDNPVLEVSVESQVAERLNIGLGDKLRFNIGSEQVEVEVTSLRKVNWQTMQPNFYFVIEPEAMADFSPTYITSFYLPTERKSELAALMAPFPTVSLFDVDARINQLRSIIDQVSAAVEFILILVLCAGTLVLIAQVQASMDERLQELAILRTLGAKGLMIRLSVVLEFVIIGLVAGFIAALANELALYLLQTQIFSMQASIHLEFWVLAPLAGALVVGLLGALACWRLLSFNTAMLLRRLA